MFTYIFALSETTGETCLNSENGCSYPLSVKCLIEMSHETETVLHEVKGNKGETLSTQLLQFASK